MGVCEGIEVGVTGFSVIELVGEKAAVLVNGIGLPVLNAIGSMVFVEFAGRKGEDLDVHAISSAENIKKVWSAILEMVLIVVIGIINVGEVKGMSPR